MKKLNTFFDFSFNDQPLRTIVKNGAVWFYAIDVFCILRLPDPFERLKDLAIFDVSNIPGEESWGVFGSHTCVTPKGLFTLSYTITGKMAYAFREWMRASVLPVAAPEMNKDSFREERRILPFSTYKTVKK